MKGLLADAVDVDEDLRNEISKTKETIEDNLAQIEMAEENERIEAEEQENRWESLHVEGMNNKNAKRVNHTRNEIKNLYVSTILYS